MLSRVKLTKAEKRTKLRVKAKFAPQGGTLAGQITRIATAKNYAGRKKIKK